MVDEAPEKRFILDVHLGRLAKYLRLCGFDSLFSAFFNDREIIEEAVRESRVILTRDRLFNYQNTTKSSSGRYSKRSGSESMSGSFQGA